jgi:hypothetical protein
VNSLAQEAREAMRQRLYARAITLYDEYLEGQPGDLRSLMEVGICHLLNGSEEAFLYIHQSVRSAIARNGPLPDKSRELWDYYVSLVGKVTAAALVIGSVAVAGCQGDDKPSFSGHKYSGGVQLSPRPPAGPKAAESQPVATSNAAAASAAPPGVVTPAHASWSLSAHRYSGGVYMPKKQVQPEGREPGGK